MARRKRKKSRATERKKDARDFWRAVLAGLVSAGIAAGIKWIVDQIIRYLSG